MTETSPYHRAYTYAVGDLHGETRLLAKLLTALQPTPADTLVFTGDYVDRGEDSVGTVLALRQLAETCHCIFLRSNHDAAWLEVWDGHAFVETHHILGARDAWERCGGTAFLDEVDARGMMRFRTEAAFGGAFPLSQAAADSQLGMVIRLWRAFLLTGDRQLLSDLWPNVQKTLAYASRTWDTDEDGLPDGQQHNTYDIEFFGPNPLTAFMIVGALKAAAAMAERLCDGEAAERYAKLARKSAARVEEVLWNGEYFHQVLDDVDAHPYQFGDGCLSDQLLGQQLAHISGLGHLVAPEHVRAALDSVWRHNFRQPMGSYVNLQRTYVMPDESGLLLCSWPPRGQPRLPFVYSDEVWSGTEYQVASHLIYEGAVQAGIELVKAVRDRYDGRRRNPWDEVECGH